MRTIVGVIAVLGVAVAVAGAQPPRERGASFRPPEPVGPNDLPPGAVARGASEEFPPSSFPPSTPVVRNPRGAPEGRGPAWLSGADPNVLPAAGSASKGGNVRSLSPAPTSGAGDWKDDPFAVPKGLNLDKLKGAARPQPSAQTPPAEQPTAETPFRGTGANGAPVYAGPPAYRWYGWGTVTPGANQFAPTGQYPKASANWYSITGATPGAFPVPVMNPLRNPPGTEPPTYAAPKSAGAPAAVVSASAPPAQVPTPPAGPVQPQPQPRPAPVERPEPPKFNPTGESKFVPAPAVPKLTQPPTAAPVAMAPVPPPVLPPIVTEPIAPAPVVPPAPPKSEPVALAAPVVPPPAPVVVPPPVVPPLPAPVVPSVEPAKPVAPEVPASLPISLTTDPKPEEPKRPEPKPEPRREEHKWEAAPEPTHPAQVTWAPVVGRPATPAPVPAPTQPAADVPAWKSGSANVKPIVARAQAGDNAPDPVETLIRQLCQGRAEGVEVRWAGTKKLMVCFEVRTAAEAQKLVTDISKRPELGPYQIDFCAVVKK